MEGAGLDLGSHFRLCPSLPCDLGNALTSLCLKYDSVFLPEPSNDAHIAPGTALRRHQLLWTRAACLQNGFTCSLIQQQGKRHPWLESVAISKGPRSLPCSELQVSVTQKPWGRDEQYYLSASRNPYRVEFL